jgi:hypothetical protein
MQSGVASEKADLFAMYGAFYRNVVAMHIKRAPRLYLHAAAASAWAFVSYDRNWPKSAWEVGDSTLRLFWHVLEELLLPLYLVQSSLHIAMTGGQRWHSTYNSIPRNKTYHWRGLTFLGMQLPIWQICHTQDWHKSLASTCCVCLQLKLELFTIIIEFSDDVFGRLKYRFDLRTYVMKPLIPTSPMALTIQSNHC